MAARNSLPPPMPSSGLRYSTEFPYLEDLFSTVALHQGTAALESVVLSELQEMLAEFLSRALENDQAERVEKLLSFQEQLEQMEIPIGVDPASVTIIPYSRINSLLPSPPSPPRAAPAPSSYPSGPVECPICLETNSPEEMRCLLSCGCHHFCRQCMEQHLATLINDAEVSKITCPAPGCQAVPEEYEINALVSEETYEKYLQFMVLAIVNEDKDAKWCPNLQCGEPICWDPKESTVTCMPIFFFE
ncbi:MAG: E3 ubiquitin protein ligase [archaeon]|nr:E3 ubiquitin protein ligase [archaeon]